MAFKIKIAEILKFTENEWFLLFNDKMCCLVLVNNVRTICAIMNKKLRIKVNEESLLLLHSQQTQINHTSDNSSLTKMAMNPFCTMEALRVRCTAGQATAINVIILNSLIFD